MKPSAYLLLLLLAQLLFTSGCVTGRREIPLDVPQASSYPTSKGSIQIGFIEDLRVFEQDPDEPSTPSIKGKVTTMPDSLKVRMIGRQRNGYGMAMGDIALPENSSILAVSRKLLEESFTRMGYAKAQSSQPNYTVDVKINEFWAWFSPGFVSVSFEARINCSLKITNQATSRTITIKGDGKNVGQIARDANWQLAYERAFEDFLQNAKKELQAAGL